MASYSSLLNKLAEGKPKGERKLLQRNTYAVDRGRGKIAVKLHATDVLTYHRDDRVEWNTGGWRTVTTRDRMNAWGPGGWRVGNDRGEMYLYDTSTRKGYWSGPRFYFFDGIGLTKDGKLRKKDALRAARLERAHIASVKAQAKRARAERKQALQLAALDAMLHELFRASWWNAANAIADGLAELTREGREAARAIEEMLAPIGVKMYAVEKAKRIAREVDVPVPEDAEWAWHFVERHFTGAYRAVTMNGDITVRAGQTLYVEAEPELCSYGLHASPTPSKAYGYCRGGYVCRVRVWGNVKRDYRGGKSVSQYRHVVWMAETPQAMDGATPEARDAACEALAPKE